jgi:hypothetical protein
LELSGYTAGVASLLVDDPVAGSPAFTWSGNAAEKFTMSTNGLPKYFEGTYGIAA